MKRAAVLLMAVAVICAGLLLSTEICAQEETGRVDAKRVEAAIKQGVEFLKKSQREDGSWADLRVKEYPTGCTALVLLALLKCGEDPDSEAIKKGFAFLEKQPFRKTYSVSCLILALAALYQPPDSLQQEEIVDDKEKKEKEPTRTTVFEPSEERARKQFKDAPAKHKKWFCDAVEWLLKQQQANIWRYPERGEDASNTQYALLALGEARRLGISIPSDTWKKVADYFIVHQEQEGPKVDSFTVPAADYPVSGLKTVEKKILEEMKRRWEEKKKTDPNANPEAPSTTLVEDEFLRQFGWEKKEYEMFARGWRYQPSPKNEVTGSMTTSGVACLVLCKVGLAKSLESDYSTKWKSYSKKLDQAIRDGCAWLAHNFSVSENPGRQDKRWHYYYLYGLERAGMLSLLARFGKNDWYAQGANYIISNQRSDGSWDYTPPKANSSDAGVIPNTCFALLFLKRATTQIIKVPGCDQIYTGETLKDK